MRPLYSQESTSEHAGMLLTEPTPKEIHNLYVDGFRLTANSELYEGEYKNLYTVNGYQQVELWTRASYDAKRFLSRHYYLEQLGAVVGPFIVGGCIEAGAMTLWRPNAQSWYVQEGCYAKH